MSFNINVLSLIGHDRLFLIREFRMFHVLGGMFAMRKENS